SMREPKPSPTRRCSAMPARTGAALYRWVHSTSATTAGRLKSPSRSSTDPPPEEEGRRQRRERPPSNRRYVYWPTPRELFASSGRSWTAGRQDRRRGEEVK